MSVTTEARLEGHLLAVGELDGADRDAMFALMQRHYANVRREVFERDLDEKRWVIQVRESGRGTLRGFSTQTLVSLPSAGRPIRALFSGDTVVDRRFWGDRALVQLWGQLALRLIDRYGGELYWFLLSKGYRTYRFLPLFFHEFYPRHDRRSPAELRERLDALAEAKFGAAYDRERGVLPAGPAQYRLRAGLGEIRHARLADPHVRFFAERNPGHPRGDELCCLAPLARENFTPAAYRVIGEPLALEVP